MKKLRFVFNKKTGHIGFMIGKNLTVKTRSRKLFRMALKCAPGKVDFQFKRSTKKKLFSP